MIMPRYFTLSFLKKEQVAVDAYSFFFGRSAVPDLDFLPGQYIKMFLDILNPDERGNSRSFSIVSSPLEKDYLMITTRIIQSAFKMTLASLTPGTQVKFFGPNGRFVFDENETKPHILLAGGIGITPFHSMLTYIAEKELKIPVTLFVSFSKVEEIIFYDELMKISKAHPNVKVIYTITHPDSPGRSPSPLRQGLAGRAGHLSGGQVDSWKVDQWTGETGRISADMIKKYCPNFSDSLFYISGPPSMVDGMLQLTKDMNVPDEQVRKEKFVGY